MCSTNYVKLFFDLDVLKSKLKLVFFREKNALTNKCDYSKIFPKVFVQLLFEPCRVIIDEILLLTLNIVGKLNCFFIEFFPK